MHFAAAVRSRLSLVGYWVGSGSPAIAERLASVGYDYADALHVGPSDLSSALGHEDPVAGWSRPEFPRALADGFTLAAISNDLSHPAAIGRDHLARARAAGAQ